MNKYLTSLLLSSLLLSACQSNPGPNGQPSAAPVSPGPVTSAHPAGGSPQPGGLTLANPASPAPGSVSPPAAATPAAPAATPSQLATIASLSLNLPQRFLTAKGQSTRLIVELRDSAGKPLALNAPLVWTSSRPADFSVDASGLVTALKDDGFADITVRLAGTDLVAKGLISVVSADNGGGGGGGGPTNARPVIASLSASSVAVLGYGIPVELSAVASDPDGGPEALTYTWRCNGDCAGFSALTGETVYWFSPAADGEYDLRVTVSDGSASVSQSVTVAVTGGSSAIDVDGELEDDD